MADRGRPVEPIVTDHALIRYIERVQGIDLTYVRTALSSPAIQYAIRMGCTSVKLGCGARVKLRGNTITTVLPRGAWHSVE